MERLYEFALLRSRWRRAYAVPSPEPSPLEALESEEERASLNRQLQRLPKRQATVLRLAYGIDDEQLSMQAIADRLGVTRERVRQIRLDGICRLRRIMQAA